MIDLWIIENFKILPTDNRFVDLYEEQKIALFEGVCSLPNQENLKKTVIVNSQIEKVKNTKEEDFVSDGMKKSMRKSIEENYKDFDNNYIEKVLEKNIKNMGNKIKSQKIKELQEFINE